MMYKECMIIGQIQRVLLYLGSCIQACVVKGEGSCETESKNAFVNTCQDVDREQELAYDGPEHCGAVIIT